MTRGNSIKSIEPITELIKESIMIGDIRIFRDT